MQTSQLIYDNIAALPFSQNTEALLQDGGCVSNVLMVDKDQVLMETIGAVQELKTLTVSLSGGESNTASVLPYG